MSTVSETAIAALTMLMLTAGVAQAHDRHDHGYHRGHSSHGRSHVSSHVSYYAPQPVVYRSYAQPVYYLPPPPPQPVTVYRQSGFGFWFF